MPSSFEENFCSWKDEPLAKMDERRKPKNRDTGTPLSFLAPVPPQDGKVGVFFDEIAAD